VSEQDSCSMIGGGLNEGGRKKNKLEKDVTRKKDV
jgi:hypothetical protein